MSSFTGYKMMGVNAYSKYPEWAAKLADWLTNEENQTIRFEERIRDLRIRMQQLRMQ